MQTKRELLLYIDEYDIKLRSADIISKYYDKNNNVIAYEIEIVFNTYNTMGKLQFWGLHRRVTVSLGLFELLKPHRRYVFD